MTTLRAVAIVVVLAGGLAACGRGSLAPGEARLSVDGKAQVAAEGKPFKSGSDGQLLRRNDRVRIVRGSAEVRLSGDRSIELRRQSLLRVDVSPELLGGDALVKAARRSLAVSAADSNVRVSGLARVSRALAVTVGVYDGSAAVDSVGHTVVVPALRQVAIPAPGLVPATPSPLAYDPSDSWDRRQLADAIELGDELTSRSRGFTAQFATAGAPTPQFFSQVLPDLDGEAGFGPSLIQPARPVGETLVGAAIARKATSGSFADRWAAVFGFRDQGASWGLVSRDQHVGRSDLLSELDGALGRAPTPFAAPLPPQSASPKLASAPTPLAPTSATPAVRPPAPPSGGGGGGGTPSPGPSPTSPPTTKPPATTTTTVPCIPLLCR